MYVLVAIFTCNDAVRTAVLAEHLAEAFGDVGGALPACEVTSLFIEFLENYGALQFSVNSFPRHESSHSP